MEQKKDLGAFYPADIGRTIRKCVSIYMGLVFAIAFIIFFFALAAASNVGWDGQGVMLMIVSAILAGIGWITGMILYGFADIVDYANRNRKVPLTDDNTIKE